jgi:plasmid stabilization system protein ParE
MIVRFTPGAKADLVRIADFIAADNPARALTFVDELEASCRALAEFPRRYPLVERYAEQGVRHRVHGNYLILYRVEEGAVVVLRIVHGATDYIPLLFPEAP